MMSPRLLPNGFDSFNGASGVLSPPMSPKGTLRSKGRLGSFTSPRATSGNFAMKSLSKRGASGGSYKIGFVQESAISLRKRSFNELGAGVSNNISDVSYVNFLEWIRAERLTTLPHKGSRWDKVLIRALYFAEQPHNFDQAIQGFALDSQAAAAVGYGHGRLLLELGHENSAALDKAFSVLYKFSLSFSTVLRRSELLAATAEIREQLCLLYTDLISLVVDVSIRFYKTANGMTSGSASLDIFELFGETIEGFRWRQDSVVELIWGSQIENEDFEDGEALDMKVLSRWLSPQDRVLATLNRDHSFFVDQQVEMTCIWFQKNLTRFLQSDKSSLLVTGQPGAGKTTLAGSIVERLQRPVNYKQAIRLAEDIAYNMRRAHGPRASVTIETYELLAQLYTSMGQTYMSKAASEKTGPLAQEYFKKALGVHEDILRLVVHEHGSGDDSDDELDTTAYLLAKEGVNVKKQEGKPTAALDAENIDKSAIALRHLQLLKLAYQRLGGWPKSYDEYERLNAQVFRTFGTEAKWKGVQGTEKWSAKEFGNGKAESQDGGFKGIQDWALGSDKIILQAHNGPIQGGANGMQVSEMHTASEQAIAYA